MQLRLLAGKPYLILITHGCSLAPMTHLKNKTKGNAFVRNKRVYAGESNSAGIRKTVDGPKSDSGSNDDNLFFRGLPRQMLQLLSAAPNGISIAVGSEGFAIVVPLRKISWLRSAYPVWM